ncbi:MAG: queuine/other tRNA-ribosyltransferase [Bacillaceae bacterium]|nr:queuine/other tRNA-ribosyltransferase [Bacillaceae bacterium]
MKYFLPYWEDKLDPDFDFVNDSFSKKHIELGSRNYDKYIHEIINNAPYDGILVSLGVFLSKLKLNEEDASVNGFKNLKEYLRFHNSNSNLELLGDCGAFNYVNEPEPPEMFNPERVAKLYNDLGFDYGISTDHLAVRTIKIRDKDNNLINKELTKHELRNRIKISLENAEKFLNIHKQKKYKFIPIGSAQGYSPITYRNSVKELVEMGYEYIALGGLARSNTREILSVLEKVKNVLKGRKLHLLGILRPKQLSVFEELGVYSFDSASYLRKAWLRSGQNYLSHDLDHWYTAIRIPQVDNPKMVESINKSGHSIEEAKELEQECLNLLRKYDDGQISLDKVINKISYYDKLFQRSGNDGKNLEEKYVQTLKDQPWKKCSCEICQSIGIDVVIFRGTNRNKRRGFHNTYVFYDFLKSKVYKSTSVYKIAE